MCAAIKGGRATVVRELIKLGADANKQDNVSKRPSASAASRSAGFQSISSCLRLPNLYDELMAICVLAPRRRTAGPHCIMPPATAM